MCNETLGHLGDSRIIVPIVLLSLFVEVFAEAPPAKSSEATRGSHIQNANATFSVNMPFNVVNSLVVEAEEAVIRTSGRPEGDSWCLCSSGTLAEVMEVRGAGIHQVMVRAYGSPMGGQWPLMALSVNGVDGATLKVDSETYQDYVFQVALEPGVHFIGVTFLNDDYNVERSHRPRLGEVRDDGKNPRVEDRNLYVDKFAVVAPFGVEEPELAGTLVMEAEKAQLRTAGEPTPGGWALTENGTLGSDVHIPVAGTYEVVVQAYGSRMNGAWPVMALNLEGVDGEVVAVDSDLDAVYSFRLDLNPGRHFIGVSFLNDSHEIGKGDRNLYIDRIVVISPPEAGQPSLAGILVLGAEEATLKTAGEPIFEGWCLCENGLLGESIQIFEAGSYRVEVRAYGSPFADIWPLMALYVDGFELGAVTVDSSGFTDYSFLVELSPGVHFVGVSFENDDHEPGIADRNLYLDQLVIESPPGLPAPKIRLSIPRPRR
jgi:hypothetical protein